MAKKKRPRRSPPPKKPSMEAVAEKAIAAIADREDKSVESIRTHMKIAMMSRLLNDDPTIKANWARIPHAGEVPHPRGKIWEYGGRVFYADSMLRVKSLLNGYYMQEITKHAEHNRME